MKTKHKEDTIIPYLLDLDNGSYYLYYAYKGSEKIYHVRLDNIIDLAYTKAKHYTKMRFDDCYKMISESYNAYSTKDLKEIRLKICDMESYVLNDIVNTFDDVIVKEDIVAFKVRISDLFLSKIISYGDKVKIISPISVIKRLKDYLLQVYDIYSDTR